MKIKLTAKELESLNELGEKIHEVLNECKYFDFSPRVVRLIARALSNDKFVAKISDANLRKAWFQFENQ